jgi:hypothetical protein
MSQSSRIFVAGAFVAHASARPSIHGRTMTALLQDYDNDSFIAEM